MEGGTKVHVGVNASIIPTLSDPVEESQALNTLTNYLIDDAGSEDGALVLSEQQWENILCHVLDRRFGWSEFGGKDINVSGSEGASLNQSLVDDENMRSGSLSPHLHTLGGSLENGAREKRRLNAAFDGFLSGVKEHVPLHVHVLRALLVVVRDTEKPVVRKQTFVYLGEWLGRCLEFCPATEIEACFETLQDMVLAGLTDVWSAIRKVASCVLQQITPRLSLAQMDSIFTRLVAICADRDSPWQASEGAVQGIAAIIRGFVWTETEGDGVDGKGKFILECGLLRVPRLPEFIAGSRPVLFAMVAHPQLSIREFTVKAFASLLARSEFQVMARTFEDVLACLNSRSTPHEHEGVPVCRGGGDAAARTDFDDDDGEHVPRASIPAEAREARHVSPRAGGADAASGLGLVPAPGGDRGASLSHGGVVSHLGADSNHSVSSTRPPEGGASRQSDASGVDGERTRDSAVPVSSPLKPGVMRASAPEIAMNADGSLALPDTRPRGKSVPHHASSSETPSEEESECEEEEDAGASDDGAELVEPLAAEGLLALSLFLMKNVPEPFLLHNWPNYHRTFQRYLAHDASTVRQAASAVVRMLVTRAARSGDVRFVRLLLHALAAGWRLGDLRAAGTGACGGRSWQWMEGRLLAYELVFNFLLSNHTQFVFSLPSDTPTVTFTAPASAPPTNAERARSPRSPPQGPARLRRSGSDDALLVNRDHTIALSLHARRASGAFVSLPAKKLRSVLSEENVTASASSHARPRLECGDLRPRDPDPEEAAAPGSAILLFREAQHPQALRPLDALTPDLPRLLPSALYRDDSPLVPLSACVGAPPWLAAVKAASLSELLQRALVQVTHCLVARQFELRRMADQVVPQLTEVLCWFDMAPLENLWRSHLAEAQSPLCWTAALCLKHALRTTAHVLPQLDATPHPGAAPTTPAKMCIVRLVESITRFMPTVTSNLTTLAKSSSFTTKTALGLEDLVIAHTYFSRWLPETTRASQMGVLLGRLEKLFAFSHPGTKPTDLTVLERVEAPPASAAAKAARMEQQLVRSVSKCLPDLIVNCSLPDQLRWLPYLLGYIVMYDETEMQQALLDTVLRALSALSRAVGLMHEAQAFADRGFYGGARLRFAILRETEPAVRKESPGGSEAGGEARSDGESVRRACELVVVRLLPVLKLKTLENVVLNRVLECLLLASLILSAPPRTPSRLVASIAAAVATRADHRDRAGHTSLEEEVLAILSNDIDPQAGAGAEPVDEEMTRSAVMTLPNTSALLDGEEEASWDEWDAQLNGDAECVMWGWFVSALLHVTQGITSPDEQRDAVRAFPLSEKQRHVVSGLLDEYRKRESISMLELHVGPLDDA